MSSATPDEALLDRFTTMGRDPYLRDFIEVHLREVLGCQLTRKGEVPERG